MLSSLAAYQRLNAQEVLSSPAIAPQQAPLTPNLSSLSLKKSAEGVARQALLPGDRLREPGFLGELRGQRTLRNTLKRDKSHYYEFQLGAPGQIRLDLSNLTQNANLKLFHRAENGTFSLLEFSRQPSTTPESIARPRLQSGTYVVQVRSVGAATDYKLTLAADLAGNSLRKARNIPTRATTQTYRDFIGPQDTQDYYRIQLKAPAYLGVALDRLSAFTNLELIQDRNGNGQVERREVLASAYGYNGGSAALNQPLRAGVYYLRVSGETSTHYSLNLFATAPTLPRDFAGNTLAKARNLSSLSGTTTYSDFVGDFDPNDYYRFTLDAASSLRVMLKGQQPGFQFALIHDANQNGVLDRGETLASKYSWGSGAIATRKLLEAGTYYLHVSRISGNIDYTLTLDATALPKGYSTQFGYGLVDAAAAVARGMGVKKFAPVSNLGGLDWGLDLVNAPEVWRQGYTGQNVVVAVIDTGVDYRHLDLKNNMWTNTAEIPGNGIDDDGNGYIDDVQGWNFIGNNNNPWDDQGHGTHVAGTIAGQNNGFGVTGVAYNATIMPVKVLDEYGYGSWDAIANGIRYAADNGAHVINLSLGGGADPRTASAVRYAAQKGVVVVIASGNEYANAPSYPARYTEKRGIAVGAIDRKKNVADFSNQAGRLLNFVAAPGVNVYSSTPNNGYDFFSGTSMAAPHVAGVAALMLSANPNLTAAEVETILTTTARPNQIIA